MYRDGSNHDGDRDMKRARETEETDREKEQGYSTRQTKQIFGQQAYMLNTRGNNGGAGAHFRSRKGVDTGVAASPHGYLRATYSAPSNHIEGIANVHGFGPET